MSIVRRGLLVLALAVSAPAALGGAARASCEAPPPDPAQCFCDAGWSAVAYVGHLRTELIPPGRRLVGLAVDAVFVADGVTASHAPGELLPLSDDNASFVAYDAPSVVVDSEPTLVWSDSWGDGPPYMRQTADGGGIAYLEGVYLSYTPTAAYCTTPVDPPAVAAALVERDCRTTLRALAPELPSKPEYRCDDNPGVGCVGGSAGLGWAGVLAALLALALRRRAGLRGA